MKLFKALLFILLSSAVVSAITEPNCTVKHGEIIKFIIITDIDCMMCILLILDLAIIISIII